MPIGLGSNRRLWKPQRQRFDERVGCTIRFLVDRKSVVAVPICFAAFRPDFPKLVEDFLMTQLREGGFRGGPLVVETLAPGDLHHLLREAKKARRFVESLVAVGERRP